MPVSPPPPPPQEASNTDAVNVAIMIPGRIAKQGTGQLQSLAGYRRLEQREEDTLG